MVGANHKTLLFIGNLALWGLVLYIGTTIGLGLWQDSRAVPEALVDEDTGAVPAQPVKSGKVPDRAIERLVKEDIFRTEEIPKPGPLPRESVELKETPLNLQLRGTAVGDNTSSYAMIFDGRTRKEEVYRVDEYVQGARIVEIKKDGVVLQGKDGKEILNLSAPESRQQVKKPPIPIRKPLKNRILRKRAEHE